MGLILFVQAPDIYIKKRQEEEKTAHTQNGTPEKKDQKGAAECPKNTNREDRREGEGENNTRVSGEVQEMVHVVVMQNGLAPPTSAGPDPGGVKVEGGEDQ